MISSTSSCRSSSATCRVRQFWNTYSALIYCFSMIKASALRTIQQCWWRRTRTWSWTRISLTDRRVPLSGFTWTTDSALRACKPRQRSSSQRSAMMSPSFNRSASLSSSCGLRSASSPATFPAMILLLARLEMKARLITVSMLKRRSWPKGLMWQLIRCKPGLRSRRFPGSR